MNIYFVFAFFIEHYYYYYSNLEMVSSRLAHILHVCYFIIFLFIFQIVTGNITISSKSILTIVPVDPIELYGLPLTILIYFIRFLPLLPLPIVICHTCGLILYNIFPERLDLKHRHF